MSAQGDSLLKVTDLAVTFDSQEGNVHAVDGVSFAIAPGETVGLVGESGCGKTITALAIIGLVRMSRGSHRRRQRRFDGARPARPARARDARRPRQRDIAMIFQDPMTSLNPVLPIGGR